MLLVSLCRPTRVPPVLVSYGWEKPARPRQATAVSICQISFVHDSVTRRVSAGASISAMLTTRVSLPPLSTIGGLQEPDGLKPVQAAVPLAPHEAAFPI